MEAKKYYLFKYDEVKFKNESLFSAGTREFDT